jgi:cytochrome c5
MNAKNRFLKTVFVTSITILTFSPLFMAAPFAMDQASIVTSSCNRCHSLKRICAKVGTDQKNWQTILKRMQNKGSGLSDQENTALVGFLSSGSAKDVGFCQ